MNTELRSIVDSLFGNLFKIRKKTTLKLTLVRVTVLWWWSRGMRWPQGLGSTWLTTSLKSWRSKGCVSGRSSLVLSVLLMSLIFKMFESLFHIRTFVAGLHLKQTIKFVARQLKKIIRNLSCLTKQKTSNFRCLTAMKILSNYVCMYPSQNFASEIFFNLLWTCHYDLFQLEYWTII